MTKLKIGEQKRHWSKRISSKWLAEMATGRHFGQLDIWDLRRFSCAHSVFGKTISPNNPNRTKHGITKNKWFDENDKAKTDFNSEMI
jgi:hypothetical protein